MNPKKNRNERRPRNPLNEARRIPYALCVKNFRQFSTRQKVPTAKGYWTYMYYDKKNRTELLDRAQHCRKTGRYPEVV